LTHFASVSNVLSPLTMRTTWQDLRFAYRIFSATPGPAAVGITSLALAIAANTTIFSVIYTVLLASPAAFNDSKRLVVVWESNPTKGIVRTPVAPATFRDWRENNHTLQQLELVAPGSPVTITGSSYPQRANLQYATPGLLRFSVCSRSSGGSSRTRTKPIQSPR
jgi:hypothetical protein